MGPKSKFLINFPTCKSIIVNYGQFKNTNLIKYMMKIIILPSEIKEFPNKTLSLIKPPNNIYDFCTSCHEHEKTTTINKLNYNPHTGYIGCK